jgi:beta-lactamase superfamily II metal-dependent hydrolase
MLNLRIVQARYGDCLVLESGVGGRRKYILVDGGPGGVYGPYLRPVLKDIAAAGGKLDLVVLSHIDEDHVVGLLELMAELKAARDKGQPPLIQVGAMWHNGFSKILPESPEAAEQLEKTMLATPSFDVTVEPPEPQPGGEEGPWGPAMDYGVPEGHQLQLLDAELGVPRSTSFPGQLATLETAPRPVRTAGIRAWLVGPSQANLDRLREKWIKWLKSQELAFGVTPTLIKPDSSEANLSSIMFLAEGSGRRILLTGDGLGDDVVAGLEQAGLVPPGGVFQVDVLKLPHHGSARNAVGSLFDRVQAKTYVISADGRYGNPDPQTLDWLVDAANRQARDIRILATNSTADLERLQKERPPKDNHYSLTVMPKGAGSMVV